MLASEIEIVWTVAWSVKEIVLFPVVAGATASFESSPLSSINL